MQHALQEILLLNSRIASSFWQEAYGLRPRAYVCGPGPYDLAAPLSFDSNRAQDAF